MALSDDKLMRKFVIRLIISFKVYNIVENIFRLISYLVDNKIVLN